VQDILGRLEQVSQARTVTLGDVVAAFGARSFLPMLMVPALLLISPLSGIPLFSSVCGLTISLVAAQMLWPGRDSLWLPARLMRQQVRGVRARQAVARLDRLGRWLDGHARRRFAPLVTGAGGRAVLGAACLFAGSVIPLFELVPFTSSLLGLAVLLIATGLMTRDGLFAVLGLVVVVIAPLVPLLALGVAVDPGPGGAI
jgi:hypothetical protein